MKLFLDSASKDDISECQGMVLGVTTNPTLMRRAMVENYESWARDLCANFPSLPISFEVITDDHSEMVRQAELIAAWGDNVFVKIPVVNSQGDFSGRVIRKLSKASVKLNVTAITTRDQVKQVVKCLNKKESAIISIFAGRIADTGVDPIPTVRFAVKITRPFRGFDVLWASPRQVLDIARAEKAGADIITVSRDILKKLELKGKDLTEYSRETSAQFYSDAQLAGYSL